MHVTSVGTEKIRLFCGTWNMAGSLPPNNFQNLENFVLPGMDMYAISFQEAGFEKEKMHVDLFEYLGAFFGHTYYCVAQVTLWEMRLCVFARTRHKLKVTCVEVCFATIYSVW